MEIVVGFILDCILGDPHILLHPVVIMGKFISFMDKRQKRNVVSGGIMAVMLIGLTAVSTWFILWAAQKIHPFLGFGVRAFMCYQIFAAKSLKTESMKVYDALQQKDVEQARKAVSMIVGRDTNVLDEQGITRAAIETVAENTSDGVIAPLFYMMIGGPVLGMVYKAINTMDSMVGYKNDRYMEYGRIPARLDDAVNYIPSRLSALLIIIAAFLAGYSGKNAYNIWKRDRRKHASPNSAQTEAAVAGALGIRLAGNAWYGGKLFVKEYIGDGIREADCEDIVAANRLMYIATGIMLLLWIMAKLPDIFQIFGF